MSHNIIMRDYPENVNKKQIKAYWDNYVAEEDWQEGCSGLYGEIRWIDHVCESYAAAEKYIKEHDRHDYDQLAVKYKCYAQVKPTQKYLTLKLRYQETYAKLNDLKSKVHTADMKSKLVTCTGCGSKLSTKYLRVNNCPLCKTDLRSQTVLNNIATLQQKYKELTKQVQEEERKLQERQKTKCEIRWLLKIEYHT